MAPDVARGTARGVKRVDAGVVGCGSKPGVTGGEIDAGFGSGQEQEV